MAWEFRYTRNYHMLGNTMSVCVLERLWTAIRNAQGYTDADMWENGVRQNDLRKEAQEDRLSPGQTKHVNEVASRSITTQSRAIDLVETDVNGAKRPTTVLQMLMRNKP